MKRTLILALLSILPSWLLAGNFYNPQPDTGTSLLDKGIIATKMIDGKNRFYAGDYIGALKSFREVLTEDKNHAIAHFRIAECYFELSEFQLCHEYVTKAIELKSDVVPEKNYLLGKVLHRLGKIDEAISPLEEYKNGLNPSQLKLSDVDLVLQQCKSAKEKIANPLKVELKNFGPAVNSRQDDYSPMPDPSDPNLLYFTSRRAQSTGGLTAGDNSYFEDIYYSKKDENGNWSDAEQVEGKINTDEYDNCSHISADGNTMYLTQNIDRYTKSSDISVAKKGKNGKWGAAKLMAKKTINTTYFDACPTLTSDEKTIYFVSERGGEEKGSDIYKSTGYGNKWSDPIPVNNLNTPENETTVWIHPSGKYLFFSSKGHDSMGGYDIFVSEWDGLNWGAPKNLGYPINSVNDDTHFRISPDGKTAYISSVRDGGQGGRDIYTFDISVLDWLKLD